MRQALNQILLVLVVCNIEPASAADAVSTVVPASSVFVFGGLLNSGNLGQTMLVVGNHYEHSGIAGAAYRAEFLNLSESFRLGGELGGAYRFGDGSSGEFWSGGTLSYRGLNFGAGQ